MHKVVRMFLNTLTYDGKYFPGTRKHLPQPIQIKLSKKPNRFSEFSTAFLKPKLNFKHLERKYESQMSFQNYRLRNTCFCKSLKSHVSVHPGKFNMFKGPKHDCNLHDSSFTTFVHHYRKISVAKSLS